MEQIKLQRTHDHKKWTDIYQSQLNLREQKMNVSKAPTSKQRIHVAKLIIATKFARIVKEKLKSRSFSCRKIANNIHPATDFANWDNDMWGTQLLCCLCSSPGLHGCVSCVTCNAIAHQLCLLKKQKFKLLVDSVEDAHLIENFKCRDCEQSNRDEGLYYKKCLSALQTQRTAILAGSIIEAGFKGRLGRLRYAKMKRSAIIIQSLVRKRRAKKVFYMWRRTELRVVRIEFDNLFPPKAKQKLFAMNSSSNVNVSNSVDSNHKIPSGYLVVTVIDPIKHLQIFRFERKLSHVSNEGERKCICTYSCFCSKVNRNNKQITNSFLYTAILIPGISALMQVVATFYFRDPYQVISHSKQQTLLIGQVVLALRDTKEFLMTQQYENMKISKKTSVRPYC